MLTRIFETKANHDITLIAFSVHKRASTFMLTCIFEAKAHHGVTLIAFSAQASTMAHFEFAYVIATTELPTPPSQPIPALLPLRAQVAAFDVPRRPVGRCSHSNVPMDLWFFSRNPLLSSGPPASIVPGSVQLSLRQRLQLYGPYGPVDQLLEISAAEQERRSEQFQEIQNRRMLLLEWQRHMLIEHWLWCRRQQYPPR